MEHNNHQTACEDSDKGYLEELNFLASQKTINLILYIELGSWMATNHIPTKTHIKLNPSNSNSRLLNLETLYSINA